MRKDEALNRVDTGEGSEQNIVRPSVRHILSLSGGKDSSALAVYMRDRVAEMEYVFSDTGEELPETYDYLDRLEEFLGKSIIRLNPEKNFRHYLEKYNGVLPDARTRWCTRMLKIRPFEQFVGEQPVINYIGIRADEDRKGYVSHKANITPRYPFIEDGIRKEDVHRILEEAGLGAPAYYEWRSRSGCYFCFFQQRVEWVGLMERHPHLYEKARAFEKEDTGYFWNQRESLKQVAQPERVEQIKTEHARRIELQMANRKARKLTEIFADDNLDDDERPCLICEL